MDLLGPILRDVSRSFYVSIRLLPKKLREPVGLAYLLARATDTTADTAGISTAVRVDSLRRLASAIQRDEGVASIVETFLPLQTNESERRLIQSLPKCFEALKKMSTEDQGDIRNVLATINRGQMLDLERPVLATASDLDEYTYLVAGCVGEFWTRLCFRHVDDFARNPQPEMSKAGKRYGMGLQLINILRDAGTDLRNGRCYFPEEELKTVGLSPAQILATPEPFMSIFQKWLDEAKRGLEAGMQYVDAINNRRVRAATALPALIGARTISLLQKVETSALQQKVKVPRNEVRAIIGTLAVTLADRESLQRIFLRYSR